MPCKNLSCVVSFRGRNMRHLRDKAECSIPIKGSALVKLLPRHTQSMQICFIYSPCMLSSIYSVCTGEMTGWSHECCVTFKYGDITNWVKKAMCRPRLPFQPWSYSTTGFLQRHERVWDLKGKVWKAFPIINFHLIQQTNERSSWGWK